MPWPPPPTRPASRAGNRGYRGSSIACPRCLSAARFLYYLPRSVLTVNGPVALGRAYYHCPHCRHGLCPWDRDLGLGDDRLSPDARPLVALAGTLAPFRRAEDAQRRLAGLQVSASTCRRVTEAACASSTPRARRSCPAGRRGGTSPCRGGTASPSRGLWPTWGWTPSRS
jgi:hypothetical protein